MKHDHSIEPHEWLTKAEHELAAAQTLFQQDGFSDTVTVHCHQTAEKALKAALLFLKTDFPFTHDLTVLVQLCREKNDSFSELQDVVIALSPLYVEQRYPFIDVEPYTQDELKHFLSAAEQIYQFVQTVVKQ